MTLIESKLRKFDERRDDLHSKSKRIFPLFFVTTLIGFFTSIAITDKVPIIMLLTFLGWLLAKVIHFIKVGSHFDELKIQYKQVLIEEFMNKYHPDVDYTYFGEEQDVRSIIKKSNLLSANIFDEEDVIIGKLDRTDFYLSEIDLKKKQGKDTRQVFKGLMFKLTMNDQNFPKTRIQSNPGLLNSLFGRFKKHPEYGFHYESKDEELFHTQFKHAFPFIEYLMGKSDNILISAEGNELLILLESDMKFLDDPKIKLKQSLINKAYFENMGKQLNTLLLLLETFAVGYDENEVLERLELKTLEKVELGSDWEASV